MNEEDKPVLSPDGSETNPNNYPQAKTDPFTRLSDMGRRNINLLLARRSALIQQAKGLDIQKQGINGELGEIESYLRSIGRIK